MGKANLVAEPGEMTTSTAQYLLANMVLCLAASEAARSLKVVRSAYLVAVQGRKELAESRAAKSVIADREGISFSARSSKSKLAEMLDISFGHSCSDAYEYSAENDDRVLVVEDRPSIAAVFEGSVLRHEAGPETGVKDAAGCYHFDVRTLRLAGCLGGDAGSRVGWKKAILEKPGDFRGSIFLRDLRSEIMEEVEVLVALEKALAGD